MPALPPANTGGMGWGGVGMGKPGVKKGPFQGHVGTGWHTDPQAMVLPTEQMPPLPPFLIPNPLWLSRVRSLKIA